MKAKEAEGSERNLRKPKKPMKKTVGNLLRYKKLEKTFYLLRAKSYRLSHGPKLRAIGESTRERKWVRD